MNAVRDTMDEQYTRARVRLGNTVIQDTASMPFVANLCVSDGCIWLGTHIMTEVFTCYFVTPDIYLVSS